MVPLFSRVSAGTWDELLKAAETLPDATEDFVDKADDVPAANDEDGE